MHDVKDLSNYIAYLLTFIACCVLFCLACITQESTNEQYCNTMKDPLLPNTVSQKDEKPHTVGLHDTAILHVKFSITEILHEKVQYRNTINLNVPL